MSKQGDTLLQAVCTACLPPADRQHSRHAKSCSRLMQLAGNDRRCCFVRTLSLDTSWPSALRPLTTDCMRSSTRWFSPLAVHEPRKPVCTADLPHAGLADPDERIRAVLAGSLAVSRPDARMQ